MTYFPRFPNAASALNDRQTEAPPLDVGSQLARHVSSIWQTVNGFIDKMADYYAAATLHDELSRLSDAELHRRGLSRDTLARDVRDACNGC